MARFLQVSRKTLFTESSGKRDTKRGKRKRRANRIHIGNNQGKECRHFELLVNSRKTILLCQGFKHGSRSTLSTSMPWNTPTLTLQVQELPWELRQEKDEPLPLPMAGAAALHRAWTGSREKKLDVGSRGPSSRGTMQVLSLSFLICKMKMTPASQWYRRKKQMAKQKEFCTVFEFQEKTPVRNCFTEKESWGTGTPYHKLTCFLF